MYKIYLFVFLSFLLVSCNSSQKQDQMANDNKEVKKKNNEPTAKTKANKTNSTNSSMQELKKYFNESEAEKFHSCHSEKGIFDDFDSSAPIPRDLVKKYFLYDFSMSSVIGSKYKFNDQRVEINGYYWFTQNNMTFFIYGVGIELQSEEEPEQEGLETRVAVFDKNQEFYDTFFIGGFSKTKNNPEYNVCRSMTIKGNQLILELDDSVPQDTPSHLRLKATQEYTIE